MIFGDRTLVWVLAIVNVLVHLAFFNHLEFHRDELLYFSMGQHLAVGYATVPPLIGWVSAVAQSIFGFSVFAARLLPALLSGVMIFLIAGITRELRGSVYAILLASVAFMFAPVGMRPFFLFQPVGFDILFWTLLWYLILKYINTGQDRILWFLGCAAAFGLLNKYLIGLLLGALVITLFFSRYRQIFTKRAFYAGTGIAILIIMPNLAWQVLSDFPALDHLSELSRSQLVHVDRGIFLAEQLLMPFAASVLTLPGLVFLIKDKKMKPFRFLPFAVIIVVGVLLLLRGKSYYTAGIFPLLISAGAVFWERILHKTWTKFALVSMIPVVTLPVIPMGLPVFGVDGLIRYFQRLEKLGIDVGRRFEDGSIHSLPQDYADMIGWEELTQIVKKAYEEVRDKETCLIYGENYGQAGAVTVIGEKYGLPDAVSFHDSFRFWVPDKFNPDINTLIYINDELGSDVESLFSNIRLVGQINDIHAREFGTKVYLCSNPFRSFNTFWKEILSRENI